VRGRRARTREPRILEPRRRASTPVAHKLHDEHVRAQGDDARAGDAGGGQAGEVARLFLGPQAHHPPRVALCVAALVPKVARNVAMPVAEGEDGRFVDFDGEVGQGGGRGRRRGGRARVDASVGRRGSPPADPRRCRARRPVPPDRVVHVGLLARRHAPVDLGKNARVEQFEQDQPRPRVQHRLHRGPIGPVPVPGGGPRVGAARGGRGGARGGRRAAGGRAGGFPHQVVVVLGVCIVMVGGAQGAVEDGVERARCGGRRLERPRAGAAAGGGGRRAAAPA